MAGTLSLLDAALERWEGWEQGDPFDPGTLDQILAAARSWRTLTSRRDIWWCESHASLAPKPIGGLQGRCDRNLAGKAAPCRIVSVDALSDTAEPEEGT